MLSKVCTWCRVERPLSDFRKGGYLGRPRSHCCDCVAKKDKARRDENIEAKRAATRISVRKMRLRSFGMTLADYDAMVAAQQNKCASCGDEMSPPVVDHCHVSGRVRGLLCNQCNTAAGLLKESPLRFAALMEYLRSHRHLKAS